MKTKHLLILLSLQIFFFQYLNAQSVYYDNETKLYGIIDQNSKNILKPTFSEMRIFENGLSKFQIKGKWGLINEKGKIVIKPNFDTEYSFGSENEGFVALEKNKKYGYANLKGELVTGFDYDYTKNFCGGIAWVQLNDKYNFIDIKGKLLFDVWFDNVFISKYVSYGKLNGSIYEISIKEKKLMNSEFQMSPNLNCGDGSSEEKLTPYIDNKLGLYGYKDGNKKIIIEPNYYSANHFSDGLAVVTNKIMKNGKWIGGYENFIINENGIEAFKIKSEWKLLDGDMRFHNGIMEFKDESKGDYILINTKGEIIKRMNEGVFTTFFNG